MDAKQLTPYVSAIVAAAATAWGTLGTESGRTAKAIEEATEKRVRAEIEFEQVKATLEGVTLRLARLETNAALETYSKKDN